MKRSHLISYIFLLVILIFGSCFSIVFYLVSESVIKTIGSIRIPGGYFFSDYDSVNPRVELNFSITNKGFTDISEFSINISGEILYFEKVNATVKRVKVFQRKEYYGFIAPGKIYTSIFNVDSGDFYMDRIDEFWDKANMSLGVYDYLTIEIKGRFFFGIVPFKAFIDSLCVTCGG